ncbi:MAG TPA: DUF5069 domain-containing protein [Limnochordia bacterium]
MAVPLRSPREKLAGYYHLARFVDKIRLHLKGELPEEYRNNFTKGLDGRWLAFAGLDAETFIRAVADAPDDASVAEWVKAHVHRSASEIEAWNEAMAAAKPQDPERIQRLREAAGHPERTDVECYFDLIDLDEGRPVPPRGAPSQG